MKNLLSKILGDQKFLILVTICFGVVFGVGGFIFIYAKGYSYLSNDPQACANCHIMQDYYDSWVKSSHHKAAACNDCHVPHELIEKYYVKGRNGFNHSKAFTLQNFTEPIRITKANLEDLQYNCIECHQNMVSDIAAHKDVKENKARCTQCHRSTGHLSLD
ncbi:MAG: cytochrome c nitrite reductase small subunit [Omnitrophica bacterium RIFCSPLOWO2_12_FULL_44_17]|uniref:Cytochrome c nitrite reductase small subunit n=1 Tax=Candidatus Danuiimicrobium aquiferis TaxID=1801832 RepID=A0A1G1KSZ5_9BACT|nr:MAG: cytochrome c nitrite reductase small subunit [Omnitrophica bacterium RIFCSPHIGHO2_02_FULL_45_28]OGW89092.1 MAG: cytochrome c nitrite reductase small subunit [Omnitrophica bacterium RIFCSPHIGHO2_12_FULL_44_12]OGW96084.1 MAG: cytochrome c nitrite reductase small subunit [Omnitrophica bacterium RIFCSPLOWO2_12_FULL_44_17]OGX02404.1 MAG: cytochrome c nitrite reductase small subunit [Omnitrophica bacterium RIFCSPLOWO2_02_FULL_44_11]